MGCMILAHASSALRKKFGSWEVQSMCLIYFECVLLVLVLKAGTSFVRRKLRLTLWGPKSHMVHPLPISLLFRYLSILMVTVLSLCMGDIILIVREFLWNRPYISTIYTPYIGILRTIASQYHCKFFNIRYEIWKVIWYKSYHEILKISCLN